MDAARIQLEGKLEQVEASIDALKRVGELLRSEEIGPRELATLGLQLEALEVLLPQLRRHDDSHDVNEVLATVRTTTERLVRHAARLCRTLGLPQPRSVHEVRRILEPHLPIRLSTRLIARWWELVMLGGMFWFSLVTTFAMSSQPRGAAPPPILLILWLVQCFIFVVRSVRVVVSATSLRVGGYEWRLKDLRKVHFELPGWSQQRGQRAVVVVETTAGRTTRVKVPNAVDGFMRAMMTTGVPTSRSTMRSWWS